VLEISSDGGKTISLSGRFDAAQGEQALAAFDAITDSCVVDLRGLDYISSAGLGILLATYKRLHDSGKTMVLKNMNDYIRRVFQVSGLDRVFTIE
jgi:anti-sigma B factor antagonist